MKKIFGILLIMVMTVSLMACGAKEETTLTTNDESTTETTNNETTTTTTDEESLVDTEETKETNDATVEEVAFENIYPEFITDETETTVTYIDKFGSETTVTKNPERVVVTYNSHLGLWYFMGGESMTKVKGSSNVPEVDYEFIDLGSSYDVSLEAIVALEPTLVLMASNVSTQVEMAPVLREMGIETMLIDGKTKSFDRFEENAYLFSKINGTQGLYNEKMLPINDKINSMIDLAAGVDKKPRVAPIFATSKSMTLETDIAQIGEIVSKLGGENIYSEADLLAEGETRIPFSIEALVTQNPEVILISTMGKVESAQATIEAMIEENPVWNEVDAVKNNRVFYLEKDLSVYKPNQRYADAFLMVSEYMYPELFSAE